MGFGCNVPAILGTRVMRDRGLRLLSILIIPFSLCSARLNVFLFMAAAFFPPRQGALVITGLYLMSFVAAVLTALLFRGRFPSQEPLVLELPPYRLPTGRQVLTAITPKMMNRLERGKALLVLVQAVHHLRGDGGLAAQ